MVKSHRQNVCTNVINNRWFSAVIQCNSLIQVGSHRSHCRALTRSLAYTRPEYAKDLCATMQFCESKARVLQSIHQHRFCLFTFFFDSEKSNNNICAHLSGLPFAPCRRNTQTRTRNQTRGFMPIHSFILWFNNLHF